jgi:hypothetical protein
MLYNPNGQIAFEQNLSASEVTLHIGNLADSTYLYKITTTEGIFTQKVSISAVGFVSIWANHPICVLIFVLF